jgi:CPA1 family monovalent cation:H+ antiporter
MTLFVAPTLLDAAYDTSLRDLRIYWIPITASAVIAVVLTVAAVARQGLWNVGILAGLRLSKFVVIYATARLTGIR